MGTPYCRLPCGPSLLRPDLCTPPGRDGASPDAESALLPGSNDDSRGGPEAESALLPGSNDDSRGGPDAESALLPGSNDDSACGGGHVAPLRQALAVPHLGHTSHVMRSAFVDKWSTT